MNEYSYYLDNNHVYRWNKINLEIYIQDLHEWRVMGYHQNNTSAAGYYIDCMIMHNAEHLSKEDAILEIL